MIYLINTKTKEHIDAVALGDAEYERLAGSSGWIFQMADTDGWIEWQGGKCPLPDDARCDVIHRSGFSSRNRPADGWAWGRGYEEDDIIAYRPILDAGEPEPPAWDGMDGIAITVRDGIIVSVSIPEGLQDAVITIGRNKIDIS